MESIAMIAVTRLSGPVFLLNPDLIERADATPDTVVTLVNGTKYVIAESLAELADLLLEHRSRIVSEAEVPVRRPRRRGEDAPALRVLTADSER
jgi:flagellar protein FlbD